MEYIITINKREKNPEYKPKKQNMYDSEPSQPQFFEYPIFTFEATAAQFEAIRKAVLEVF